MAAINRALNGYRLAQTIVGDTLQSFAAREMNDASKWTIIAAINSLQHPFLTINPECVSATVSLYGSSLLIPASVTQVSAQADPNAVFGIDIDLTTGAGDLVANAGGDIQTISGVANLEQALTNKIMTPLRELIYHLAYGCGVWRLVGKGNTPTNNTLAARYVKDAMRSDPRVQAVPSCTASAVGSAIPVTAVVQPVAGKAINLAAQVQS